MAGIAAGHDAVKQIHAAGNSLDHVARGADTHQIADLILGHIRLHLTDHLVHHFGRLTHGQTSDGVAVQLQLRDLLHVLYTQVSKGASLIDAKQQLVGVGGLALLL